MPSSNARTATIFAALTLALITPASALDFNKPNDKRVYCQVYATQALSDVQSAKARGCGLSGASWSGEYNDHFNWCMSQGDMAATMQENVSRSTAAQQCNGSGEASFPPVIDAPQEAASTPLPVEEAPAATSSEPETAALPPVVEEPAPGRAASATPLPVVEADEPAVGTETPDTSISSHREEAREVAERLIEFGREHKHEIKHAAHELKEKIKDKLSELKERHNQKDAGSQQLRAKVKDALKSGLMRRLANR